MLLYLIAGACGFVLGGFIITFALISAVCGIVCYIQDEVLGHKQKEESEK